MSHDRIRDQKPRSNQFFSAFPIIIVQLLGDFSFKISLLTIQRLTDGSDNGKFKKKVKI